MEKKFYADVAKLQSELKAPKGQFNSFGKYNYRSCEDILESVKPLCIKYGLTLNITDDIIAVGDRYYIKATASLINVDGEMISSTGLARESENKKGMDDSQITGTASSYARKYALGGLLCLDDTKDADTDEHYRASPRSSPKKNDPPKMQFICSSCGCEIKDVKKSDGTIVTAEDVYKKCATKCVNCYKKG